MEAVERLLKYVKIDTQSDENTKQTPSTKKQLVLAELLCTELKDLGVENAKVDEWGYVYGSIPATAGYEDRTKLGFIAHMDTAPDYCGKDVQPQVITDYDGGDVALGTSGKVLRAAEFSHLRTFVGRTLITTDGTTLLGADDKAGVAEIMTSVERIFMSDMPHGKISIAFTPDEEIGEGADHFDLETFGAEFAYTLDGGEEGEIVYENFNACQAYFKVLGNNVHPGSAKNIMVNASLVAMEINGLLPGCEIPARTEGYEGFYHLCGMEGNVESAELVYIVRDHDKAMFESRKRCLLQIEKQMQEKYGKDSVRLTITDQYENMEEKIRPCMHLVERARNAIKASGLTPVTFPERGGTDGARLSFMGLPCPNLGTGGFAFHGPYEHVTAEGMENSVRVILNLIKEYAN